jgi:hypothetical protein
LISRAGFVILWQIWTTRVSDFSLFPCRVERPLISCYACSSWLQWSQLLFLLDALAWLVVRWSGVLVRWSAASVLMLACSAGFGVCLESRTEAPTADSRLRFCCCCFVPASICACLGFCARLESGLRPRWSGSASQFGLVHGVHFCFGVGFLQISS